MPKEFPRHRRVADLIQRELAMWLEREGEFRGIGLITISGADVSPDLKNARIFVTSLDDRVNPDDLIAHLNDNAGKYRQHLAKTLRLRVMPRLSFEYDASIERASHISTLLDNLKTHDH